MIHYNVNFQTETKLSSKAFNVPVDGDLIWWMCGNVLNTLQSSECLFLPLKSLDKTLNLFLTHVCIAMSSSEQILFNDIWLTLHYKTIYD